MWTDNTDIWLISVCAGKWQLCGIKAAIKFGIKVFAVDGDSDAPGLKVATQYSVVDVNDFESVLDAIKKADITPSGVVSIVSEVGMKTAAKLREYYNLTGPDVQLTRLLNNKVCQREICQKASIPGPAWVTFSSVKEAKEFVKKIGFPCIIKPSESSGSRGVTKVFVESEVEYAAQQALYTSSDNMGLIEEFMDGCEYTVETFGDGIDNHVLAVTEKRKVPGTNSTVASELYTPLDSGVEDKVSVMAVEVLDAIGYKTGPGHTEIILSSDGALGLVETAGRGGGFMVFEKLVKKVSGYNIVEATILQSVGLAIPSVCNDRNSVDLRFFPAKKGIVKSLKGFEDAAKLPGVEAEPFVKEGDSVRSVQGDADRIGYILSEASSTERAIELANMAEELISIEII